MHINIPLKSKLDSLYGMVKLVDIDMLTLVSCTVYAIRLPLWSTGGSSIQDTDAVVLERAVNEIRVGTPGAEELCVFNGTYK